MIYFIRSSDGPIKIGFSYDPEKRLKALQTASHNTLFLVGTIEGNSNEEQKIHILFEKYKIRGEWYKPTVTLINYINENCPNSFWKLTYSRGIEQLVNEQIKERLKIEQALINLKKERIELIKKQYAIDEQKRVLEKELQSKQEKEHLKQFVKRRNTQITKAVRQSEQIRINKFIDSFYKQKN